MSLTTSAGLNCESDHTAWAERRSDEKAEAVSALKQQEGGDILVAGSRSLVQTLIEHDLVDEYRLMVFPVILGSGRRLFPDDAAEKKTLKLVGTQTFDSGVAVHTYHPAAA